MIDSDAIEDKCGICKGDGTKCSLVQGEFTKTVSQSGKNSVDCAHGLSNKIAQFLLVIHRSFLFAAYVKIVTIPRGARSVQVSERKASENMLAVKLEKDKTYCINGDK